MPKKLATKFKRLTLLFVAICGGIIVILLLVITAEASGPIHAAIWHMRHGNTVSFDGHRFHLPLLWYPDPDSHPGQFGIQRAQFGSMAFSHITLATEPRQLDDHAAINDIAVMTAHLNKHELDPSSRWTTEALQGRSLAFHCTMQTSNGAEETLICQAAGSNLRVLAITMGRSAHTQALDVIETCE